MLVQTQYYKCGPMLTLAGSKLKWFMAEQVERKIRQFVSYTCSDANR